jgi:hypothetical protein
MSFGDSAAMGYLWQGNYYDKTEFMFGIHNLFNLILITS